MGSNVEDTVGRFRINVDSISQTFHRLNCAFLHTYLGIQSF